MRKIIKKYKSDIIITVFFLVVSFFVIFTVEYVYNAFVRYYSINDVNDENTIELYLETEEKQSVLEFNNPKKYGDVTVFSKKNSSPFMDYDIYCCGYFPYKISEGQTLTTEQCNKENYVLVGAESGDYKIGDMINKNEKYKVVGIFEDNSENSENFIRNNDLKKFYTSDKLTLESSDDVEEDNGVYLYIQAEDKKLLEAAFKKISADLSSEKIKYIRSKNDVSANSFIASNQQLIVIAFCFLLIVAVSDLFAVVLWFLSYSKYILVCHINGIKFYIIKLTLKCIVLNCAAYIFVLALMRIFGYKIYSPIIITFFISVVLQIICTVIGSLLQNIGGMKKLSLRENDE